MPEGFSLFMHLLVGWGRGDTAASTHAAWRGRPHASYALEREGRDTIWLNGLFRGFAVHNVLAGKVAIGQCGCVAGT